MGKEEGKFNMRTMALASSVVLMSMAFQGCPPRKPEPTVGQSGTWIMKAVEIDAFRSRSVPNPGHLSDGHVDVELLHQPRRQNVERRSKAHFRADETRAAQIVWKDSDNQ